MTGAMKAKAAAGLLALLVTVAADKAGIIPSFHVGGNGLQTTTTERTTP